MTTTRKVRLGSGLTALALLAGLAWLVVLAVLTPFVLGWKSAVITSGSMQPALHRGDVVLGERYTGQALGPGTVVVFEDAQGGLVTHRITANLEDGTYATKGDANQTGDAVPVPADRIVATGRALVPRVGIVPVLLREGDAGGLLMVAAAVAALALLARWGLTDAGAIRPVGGMPYRARIGWVGGLVALELVGALAALPGAKAAWVAPTGNGVSTLSSLGAWSSWYLDAASEGTDSLSSPYLRLGTTSPTYGGPLPNYDADRNTDPGLTIAPTTLGISETDPARSQLWAVPASPGAQDVTGSLRLVLPTALRNFATSGAGRMTAGLFVCDDPPVAASCGLQSSVTVDRPSGWSGGLSTFVSTVFDFGAVNIHVPGNQSLAVKVVVDDAGSVDSMWLAYDTVLHAASLVLT